MLETPTLLFISTTPTTAIYTLFGLSESTDADYLLRMNEGYSSNTNVWCSQFCHTGAYINQSVVMLLVFSILSNCDFRYIPYTTVWPTSDIALIMQTKNKSEIQLFYGAYENLIVNTG
jgi:hypothetical protein